MSADEAVVPPTLAAPTSAAIAQAVDRLRTAPPRVHALLAPVAQPLVANLAAAVGIDISMTVDAQDVAPMAAASDALLVNLGMMDPVRREGALAAVASGCPFVLDPVKVDRAPDRLAFAKRLVASGPLVVKGNGGEMAALGPLPDTMVSATTGRVDRVARGHAAITLHNGAPLMDRVIATGCGAGMLVAAFTAVEPDPFVATAAALSLLNVAAEAAAAHPGTRGPGSFAVALIDALAALDGAAVQSQLTLADNA
ncbi:MAG: hydroxyethylthiazole kinase [Pseudomonadota bacterium]